MPSRKSPRMEACKTAIMDAIPCGDRIKSSDLIAMLHGAGFANPTIKDARAWLVKRGRIVRSGGGSAGPIYWSAALAAGESAQTTHMPPIVRRWRGSGCA